MSLFKFIKRKNIARQPQAEQPNQKVISYYTASKRQLNSFERHNQALRSENIIESRANKLKRSWFYLITLIIIVLSAAYVISLNRQATIDIKGPLYRSASEYQQVVNSVLSGDIRNYTKATINTNNIKNQLIQKLPESSRIDISTDILGHRPIVTIYTDKAQAIFKNPNSTSFVLSDRGRLLLPTNVSKVDTTKLPIIDNQTGIEGKAGDQFLSPEESNNFASLLNQNESATGLVNYILPANPREIYLAATDSRGYQIRYLLNNEITLQHGAYKAAIKKLIELNQVPTRYIDVRLIDKVYYQ